MDIQETAVAMVRATRECEQLAKQLAAWIEDRSRKQLPIGIPDIESYLKLRSIRTGLEDLGLRFQNCLEAYDHLLASAPFTCAPFTCDPTEKLDDRSIYVVYAYMERMSMFAFPRPSLFRPPCLNVTAAIGHLLDLRGNKRTTIRFKDGSELLNRQLVVPRNVPAEAISADSVAGYCLGMTLNGKRLSFTLLRHLIQEGSKNILAHIIRTEKALGSVVSPDKLLLTVLHEMPSGGVLQTIAAIEEAFPGTIAAAEDAFGRNALWFALRLFALRWNADAASAVGEYLVSHGCDPDKPFGDAGGRFSWNTMARIVTAIERYERSLPADERGAIVGI